MTFHADASLAFFSLICFGFLGALGPLLPTILGFLGGAVGGGGGGNDDAGGGTNLPPELQQLFFDMIQQEGDRYRYMNPLHQATMSGIFQMLPNFARSGVPNMLPFEPSPKIGLTFPQRTTSAPSGTGYSRQRTNEPTQQPPVSTDPRREFPRRRLPSGLMDVSAARNILSDQGLSYPSF